MKTSIALFTAVVFVLLGGCSNERVGSGNKSAGTEGAQPASVQTMPPAIDVTTPDRALKSYWQTKDARRKIEFDWRNAQNPEREKLYGKIGFDARKLMTGDVLSVHQAIYKRSQFVEYSRELVDVKLDTESRATAMVKVRNSTPIPEGMVVFDSDKKLREEGDRFKYVLEKESDGWKVAQVIKFSKFNIILKKDPWENVFEPTVRERFNTYDNVYVQQFDN